MLLMVTSPENSEKVRNGPRKSWDSHMAKIPSLFVCCCCEKVVKVCIRSWLLNVVNKTRIFYEYN